MAVAPLKYEADRHVSDRIRRRRIELGLSQRQLAFRGCSYAYISRLEAGMRTPSIGTLIGLAERLAVTPLWLATGREDGGCPFCLREH